MKNKIDRKPLRIDEMDCFKYVLEHIDNDVWDLIVDSVSRYLDEVVNELPITDDEQDILQEQLVDYCFNKIYSLKGEEL